MLAPNYIKGSSALDDFGVASNGFQAQALSPDSGEDPETPGCNKCPRIHSWSRLSHQGEGQPKHLFQFRHLQQSWKNIWTPSAMALAGLRFPVASL